MILFGISGVGKTTAAQAIVSRYPDILHFQASTLLKAALERSGEELRTADEKQIAKNQTGLAMALRRVRARTAGRPAIVDAHSVIDNDHALVDVPLETFAELKPVAVVFLRAEPEIIFARRLEDIRSRPSRSAEQLAEYQDRAQANAARHAEVLNASFSVLDAADRVGLAEFVAQSFNLQPTPPPEFA